MNELRALGNRLRDRIRLATFAIGLTCVPSACEIEPYAYLTEVKHDDRAPRASDCGGCHVEIYAEFQASRHATSFTEPQFVAATSDYSFESCLGCHAPDTIYTEGAPRLRSAHREEGVTCISCHFDGEVLAGPAPSSALARPHPIAAERMLYRSAELCGKCHEGTFREWRDAPQQLADRHKPSCQECHMRPVERTLTQGTDALSRLLVSFEDRSVGRAHSFDVAAVSQLDGAFVAEAALMRSSAPKEFAGITASQRTRVASVRLTNLVPHQVPTGDFGFRKAAVEITWLAPSGAEIASSSFELFKELKTALAPGETRTFECALLDDRGAVPDRARVVVTTGKREGPRVILFERVLAVAGGGE